MSKRQPATAKAQVQQEKLRQLRGLATDPRGQAAYALTLLDARNGAETVITALQVLQRTPHRDAREPLWQLYHHYSDRGQRQDPAAFIRAAIVRALREVVLPADIAQLAVVTNTFVFPPPEFKEEGAMLRSTALLALNELDDDLGRYHAVRLLANEYTDPMSGEPALTAAKVLAARNEILPLYFYVMQDGARTLPEVVSACLSNLVTLRTDLVPGLIERFQTATNEVILVGLFDLLLAHEAGPQGIPFLERFLVESSHFDAYRYLVVTMATSGKGALLELLLDATHLITDQRRGALLVEGLQLVTNQEAHIAQRITQLQSRLKPSTSTRRGPV